MAAFPHEPVAGWELRDAPERGSRRRDPAEAEVAGDRARVEMVRRPVQSRHLGGELQHRATASVVQRLDPETVARQEQPAPALVPHSQGEHAPQPLDHRIAVVLVEVHEDLGVGGRAEAVPGGDTLMAQLREVVDLAVVDDPDATVLAGHGMMPGREVDDLKASHAESRRTIDEEALVVRAAMVDAIGHPLEHGSVGDAIRARQDVADDAAHQPSLRAGFTGIRSVGSAGERTSPPASMPTVSRTK